MAAKNDHMAAGRYYYSPQRPVSKKKMIMAAVLTLLCLSSVCQAGGHQHVYTDSFPDWDDYDFAILDPNTANGSPYGGFSRATRSRLAALSLQLPGDLVSWQQDDNSDSNDNSSNGKKNTIGSSSSSGAADDDDDEPMYMQVKDSQGRSFACRVYHEDELDPDSLNDSMFDAPKLRKEVSVDVNSATDDDAASSSSAAAAASSDKRRSLGSSDDSNNGQSDENTHHKPAEIGDGSEEEIEEEVPGQDEKESSEQTREQGEKESGGVDSPTSLSEPTGQRPKNDDNGAAAQKTAPLSVAQQGQNVVEASRRLAQLKGICGQIHKGWWSYEWCYESTISQFHLQLDKSSAEKMRIESISSLGHFESRSMIIDVTGEPANLAAQGKQEIARVVDEHTDGALCEETGERRKSFVTLQCCNAKTMEKTRGLLHKNHKRVQTHIAAVMQIVEKPTCTYNVTVCTPLLCRDLPNAVETTTTKNSERISLGTTSMGLEAAAASGGGAGDGPGSTEGQPEGSSVRDILDYALGKYCIESDTGGWWTYEFCHGRKIRQYHEAIGTSRSETGSVVMTRSVETEHILGIYDPETANAHPGEDWRFVVNTTTSKIGGGNGAYFELEYVGGDVCDHSDVTDAAIIAGSAGSGGVERASSVRYYCGELYTISVNEDSTCHYVVHVTVPNLCKHPLFLAPVSKRQFFKCLPVDD